MVVAKLCFSNFCYDASLRAYRFTTSQAIGGPALDYTATRIIAKIPNAKHSAGVTQRVMMNQR